MNPESTPLSPHDSLTLIATMIAQAKGTIQRNSFYFLLWGWVVALANVGMFAWATLGYAHPYLIWTITIPAWVITLIRVFRNRQRRSATTHFDRISGVLWMSFGIVIFTIVVFGFKLNYQINPVILLISTLPTLVSGVILKFKPLMFGGASFWIFGVLCFLVPFEYQPLVGAVAIITGYLIPGYLLRARRDS